MTFEGFPASTRFTPVPDVFLNRFVPQMTSEEIRLMLAVFNLMYRKKGYPRYVTEPEVAAHPVLAGSTRALEFLQGAVDKGLLLPLTVQADGKNQDYFFLNNPEGKKAIEAAGKGELKLKSAAVVQVQPVAPALPDIFTLYEKNVGLITPMVAEELKDAINTYPEDWIRDALKEAVSLNKRSMRYIQRILENWTNEGKGTNATHRPDTERNKYIHGRYGGLVQH